MSSRNIAALIMTAISLAVLVPGLSQPILHLTADAKLVSQMAELQTTVIDKSRSILGTAHDLYHSDNFLVAALIVFFCIVIPLLKSSLLILAILSRKAKLRLQIDRILHAIGKWSMADVFLVAILLSWLATGDQNEHARQNITVFGMQIPVEMGLQITTHFGSGFWWFLSYCLLSLAAIQASSLTERAGP